MSIPADKLEKIINDPDFLSLPEAEQDSFLQEVEQSQPQPNRMMDTALNVIPGAQGYKTAMDLYGKARTGTQDIVGNMIPNPDESTQVPQMNASGVIRQQIPALSAIDLAGLGNKLPSFLKQPAPKQMTRREAGRDMSGNAFDALAGEVIGRAPAFVGGKILKPLANSAESTAGRLMNFYIKPRQAAYSFGRNPGRAVTKYIGPTLNREALLEKIVSQKDALLGKLAEVARTSTGPVDATPIFEEIASTVEKLKGLPKTYSSQIESHLNLAEDMASILRQKGQVVGGKIYVNPEDAIQIKRALGELPSWSATDPKLGSLSKTTRKAYGRFDREIDKSVQGAQGINQDVSDLIGAQKGIELGMQREQNKYPIGLVDLAAGIAFGGGALVPSAGAVLASKAVRSAPFVTTASSATGNMARGARATGEFLEASRIPTPLEAFSSLLKRDALPAGPKALPATPTDLTGPAESIGLSGRPFNSRALPEPPPSRPAIRLQDSTQPKTVMAMPDYVESQLMAKYGDTARVGQPRPSGLNRGVQAGSEIKNPIIEAMREALARRTKNFPKN